MITIMMVINYNTDDNDEDKCENQDSTEPERAEVLRCERDAVINDLAQSSLFCLMF